MKNMKFRITIASVAFAIMAGCAQTPSTPTVSDNIRKALDQANYKEVSVTQDKDKSVVTLGGTVGNAADKSQAEAIATPLARGQVVSNQIAVVPLGSEKLAKAVDSDVDKAIGSNLDAALLKRHLHDAVKYEVKNGVVTLTGDVHSRATRRSAERIARAIPHVAQVVDELQVKPQRATSVK